MPEIVNDDGNIRSAARCLNLVRLAEGGRDQEEYSRERLEINSRERLEINSRERLEINSCELPAKNS